MDSWASDYFAVHSDSAILDAMRRALSTRAAGCRRLAAAFLGLALSGCAVSPLAAPRSAVEREGFERPSTPDEIIGFVERLVNRYEGAELMTIGRSSGGRPLVALVIAADRAAGPPPITVLIIGSQHGTEPSGGEAIQILAREILSGPHQDLRADFELILIPDANPDGRAARRRVNGNGINLSTNYNVASEPETRAILAAIGRWRPDVVLDVHESAILKKKTLGAQGYMTDFQAQLEVANNPNVDAELSTLSESMLAESIARTNALGVPAQRYIGEITDVGQPITHGGLSVKNLRNMAGMHGSLSFLIENRLDPPGQPFPTPRNLQGRVEKQLASIHAFLATCRARRAEIGSTVAAARERWRAPPAPTVFLLTGWGANRAEPEIAVPLRRIADGVLERRVFARHDVIESRRPLRLPRAYAVTAHQEELRPILDSHRIVYEILAAPVSATLTVRRVGARLPVAGRHGWGYTDYELEARRETVTLPAGTLWIDLDQPLRRLIPLLLEPGSNSSVFQDLRYAKLIEVGRDFFVHRVDED